MLSADDPLSMCYPDPESRAEVVERIQQADGVFREYRVLTKDGSWRTQMWADFPMPDDTLIAAGLDVTDRKRAEQAQAFLVRELDHRVKNVLATVEAVAGQTLRSSLSLDEFGQALSGRIRALARIHELLSRRDLMAGLDLRELAEAVLAPLAGVHGGRVVCDGDGANLVPGAARVLGMALYELATNAAKYGALSVPDGRVSVSWSETVLPSGEKRLRIQWGETGGPSVVEPSRRGVGIKMIQEALPYELGAEVQLEFAPGGVRCGIEVPSNRVTGAAAARSGGS
jgi:two-component system CheB/CheR fusion protein